MNNDHRKEAIERLVRDMGEARARGAEHADIASLATADTSARPSVRMITVLSIDDNGPLFFANIDSGKGRQLTENPRACLCFYWPEMLEQAVVEGDVEVQSGEVSDRYWGRRLRETQLVAWASDQSSSVDHPGSTQERLDRYQSEFSADRVKRRENWCAFRIVPDRIEFWPTNWRRVRERVRYSRGSGGEWVKEMVAP